MVLPKYKLARGMLKARLHDGKILLTDAKGGTAMVAATAIMASNGVIHVINA